MTNDRWTNIADVGARLGAYETFSKTFIPPEQNNLQNVFTPYKLCEAIVAKLGESEKELKERMFLCLNMEFVEALLHCGVPAEYIWFLTDCPHKAQWARKTAYKGLNVLLENEMLEFMERIRRMNMKFDIVVGNPPYQAHNDEDFKKTQSIWGKFAILSCELTKENGYTCLVHPSGWRNYDGKFEEARMSICAKQLEYIEIHDEQDGLKTFGATTRYDWYVRKNIPTSHDTEILDQEGKLVLANLEGISFVPNSMIDRVFSMLAKPGEEKVEVICDYAYGTVKTKKAQTMDTTKHDGFIYPVIYSTPVRGPTVWYSNTNKNGHFGIPKVVLNPSRPIGFVIDEKGEYGMSEYCVGIVGEISYLRMVADVIANQKTNGFAEFMESCHLADNIFNKNVISFLRHDFWREFVNEDGEGKG